MRGFRLQGSRNDISSGDPIDDRADTGPGFLVSLFIYTIRIEANGFAPDKITFKLYEVQSALHLNDAYSHTHQNPTSSFDT